MQFVCGPLSVTLYSPEVDEMAVTMNQVSSKVDRLLTVYAPAVFSMQAKLDALQASFDSFTKEFVKDMAAIDDALKTLTDEVERSTTVESSAITLIQGLATQIQAVAGDPAAVLALASKLKTSSDDLAAKIAANTPSASATTA